MKILSAKQIHKADKKTIKKQNITSLELMERAADSAFHNLMKPYKDKVVKFTVLCGIGNNGGDGLVIARKILKYGFEVSVFIMEYSKNCSADFKKNLQRLEKTKNSKIHFLNENTKLPDINQSTILIDAVFGIGLNRKMPKWIEDWVEEINKINLKVIAIDIPTGMFADGKQGGNIILEADRTLTFQTPKLAFFLPETARFTGQIEVLDIGLDQKFIKELPATYHLIEEQEITEMIQVRPKFAHKGTFGHVLISGGSYGMMGSIILASKAALRIGAGKVSSLIPQCGYTALQTAVPEAMVLTAENHNKLTGFLAPDFQPETIVFGPGAGTNKQTADFFMELMKFTENPMLIDADGLNLLAKFPVLQEFIPKDSVLTPHPGELKRLLGDWDDDLDKIEKAKDFAKKHQVILLIKGAHSMIIGKENITINSTGNPGMATAGSGDVLSGVIGSLMAQGYASEKAAVLGVYLHGKAGDLMANKYSEQSLIAGDLIKGLKKGWYDY